MSRVACYVDGFNLYHAIRALERPELRWLNLRALAASYLEKEDTLAAVTYFTAVLKWSPEKCQRHRAYIDALSACDVTVVELRKSYSSLSVEIAAPPGRLREARQLCSVASHFSEISPGRLGACLLPRNVFDPAGRRVAACPARYLPLEAIPVS